MNRVKRSSRHRLKAAGLMILTAAVVFALSGCSRTDGNDNAGGAESPAMPSPVAQSPSPVPQQTAVPQTADPTATAEGTESPALAAFLDPAKLQPVFGFADETGSHILVTSQEDGSGEQMESLNTAIGNGGQVLAVKFGKRQAGSENSNGRELANNFANLAGFVYTVEGGAAKPDETYYLADSSSFPPAALVDLQPADQAAPQLAPGDPVRKSIAAVKHREIQSAWKLADLALNRKLYLVQFIRQDKDMLFSLVLNEDGKLSFMDYPAVIENDEYSVWRVDDGGEMRPEMFSLLFAAQSADGLLLGLNWWGAEGVNSFFLLQQGNAFKELEIQYGRYTSPI
ncbi:hypothetical protein [Paenibacillus phytohabitans]|uniref:hypothetical protein n=1 Tax=Paenibacillus phytohabitans TaxID=2654978 RepID=UPI003008EC46